MKTDRPCCVGCGKEKDCRVVCTRFLQYQLDSIDAEPKPILTAKEKRMEKFNKFPRVNQ